MKKLALIGFAALCVISLASTTIAVVFIRLHQVRQPDVQPNPQSPIGIHSSEHKPSKVYTVEQGGLKVDVQLGNDQISRINKTGYLLVTLTPTTSQAVQIKKQPLNLSIVIDHSGSMSGDKIANVKSALAKVADMLSSEDYVSIVMYDDSVKTIYESSRFNKERYVSAINSITADGSTYIEGGLREGIKNINNSYRSGYLHRVILLSDGLANVGISTAEGLASVVKDIAREGVTISTVGVGSDYDENLMTKVALAGRGNYYFLQNSSEAGELFSKEFSSLQQTIAKDIKIEFGLQNGYRVVRGVGYELKQSDFFQPFDIYQGASRSYLFEFNASDLTSSELANLQVSFTSLVDNKAVNFSIPLSLEVVDSEVNPLSDDLLYREYMRSYIAERMWTVDDQLTKVQNKEALDTISRVRTELEQALKRLPGEFAPQLSDLETKQKFIEQLGESNVNDTSSGRNFKKDNQSSSYQQIYNK
jgi:Ca-activated chloride channel family protein